MDKSHIHNMEQKKPRGKIIYILYNSIYIKLKNRQNYLWFGEEKKRILLGRQGGTSWKGVGGKQV